MTLEFATEEELHEYIQEHPELKMQWFRNTESSTLAMFSKNYSYVPEEDI